MGAHGGYPRKIDINSFLTAVSKSTMTTSIDIDVVLLEKEIQAKYVEWNTEHPRRSDVKCFELFKMCLTKDGKHVLKQNEKLRQMIYQDAKECRFHHIFDNEMEFELATYKLVYVIEKMEKDIKAEKKYEKSQKECCVMC
jgi:hypothetical protein